jgi:hypothetical protein
MEIWQVGQYEVIFVIVLENIKIVSAINKLFNAKVALL